LTDELNGGKRFGILINPRNEEGFIELAQIYLEGSKELIRLLARHIDTLVSVIEMRPKSCTLNQGNFQICYWEKNEKLVSPEAVKPGGFVIVINVGPVFLNGKPSSSRPEYLVKAVRGLAKGWQEITETVYSRNGKKLLKFNFSCQIYSHLGWLTASHN